MEGERAFCILDDEAFAVVERLEWGFRNKMLPEAGYGCWMGS